MSSSIVTLTPLCRWRDAHEAIDRVERRDRSSWPAILRIVGHAEPAHGAA